MAKEPKPIVLPTDLAKLLSALETALKEHYVPAMIDQVTERLRPYQGPHPLLDKLANAAVGDAEVHVTLRERGGFASGKVTNVDFASGIVTIRRKSRFEDLEWTFSVDDVSLLQVNRESTER